MYPHVKTPEHLLPPPQPPLLYRSQVCLNTTIIIYGNIFHKLLFTQSKAAKTHPVLFFHLEQRTGRRGAEIINNLQSLLNFFLSLFIAVY